MPGRKTKLTRRLLSQVQGLIRAYRWVPPVCGHLGISKKTFHMWYNRGKEESARLERPRTKPRRKEALYLEFYETVTQGRHLAEADAIQNIRDSEAWQSDAWFLERTFPERWSVERKKETLAETLH